MWVFLGVLTFSVMSIFAQSQAGAPSEPIYSVSERGPHHKVFERVENETGIDGKVFPHPHTYQEMATGMHYREGDQWLESDAKIELLPNNAGATAAKGQHKVIFPPEIKAGLIELQTPDQQWMRSRVWGLAYFDAASGESVLLAEVKASTGQIVGDNVVAYLDAFTDLGADLRYTYTLAGFEQDVVLNSQPPTPEELGLDSKTTRLQVLTEFVEAQTPATTIGDAGGLVDATLGFGVMSIGPGKAFSIDDAGEPAGPVPVAKSYQQLDGRNFLIEEVRYELVSDQLRRLPPTKKYQGASLERRGNGVNVLAGLKKIMPKRYAKGAPQPGMKRMARASAKTSPSFVMDYVTLTSQTNFTFKGDTTYYISGAVNLSGTTTIEGSAVIKFAQSSSAKISSTAPVCLTDAYRMAFLTSMNDNSTGEAITGSSGSPTTGPATFLEVTGGGSTPLQYLRFAYASNAISHTSFSGDVNPVWHSQFLKCGAAIQSAPSSGSGSVRLYNVLLSQCGVGVRNTSSSLAQYLRGEQLTADYVTNLLTTTASNGSCLYLTNSLITGGGGISPGQGSTNLESSIWLASNAGIYQKVGGGSYYLATSSTNRDAGTTNLNADLLLSLGKKTTYPPVAYTNVTFTNPTNFSPQAQRDSDVPDLGYHYEPLDVTFGGCTANSNITFTAGTAVGWFRTSSGYYHAGHGIHLGDRQVCAFQGTVTAPCYWVRLGVVQEQDRTAGYGTGGMTGWASNLTNAPDVQARFTRFSMLMGDGNHFRDDNGWLNLRAQDCEFYSGGVGGYVISMYFTNCFFGRTYIGQVDGDGPCSVVLRNCTKIGNWLQLVPYLTSTYLILDSAFEDVTYQFSGPAASGGTATYDYIAYTNASNPFPVGGTHNVAVSGFNWQSGWLGNFYLPTNSTLINTGSVTASAIGLYHYTTQTNQAKETNSQVDIGFHYLALDGSHNPVDSDVDGTPDYLEDSNGNGIQDAGETLWGISILTQPASQSVFVGDDAAFSIGLAGVAPFAYQWRWNGTNISGATNLTLVVTAVQPNNAGDYSVVVSNISGSITSAIAELTVQLPAYIVPFGSLTNYTFKGDTTYYLPLPINLYGTNVLEGGAVLKYASGTNTQMNVYGALNCETAPYRPAIFTAKDDDSVGEIVSGSTGNPSVGGCYGNAAIEYEYAGAPLNAHDLRINYKNEGIKFGVSATHEVQHCQFYRVGSVISGAGAGLTVNMRNLLIYRATSAAFAGTNVIINAEHITAHEVANLVGFTGSSGLYLTNSLLVLVTNWGGAFTSVSNGTNSTGTGVFQAVGGGLHYLATNSVYRDVGTTNINASLLATLRQKTTLPPVVLSNLDLTADIVFSPQAQRDADLPDLGYHYALIDHALGGVSLSGASATVSPGTVIATFGTLDRPYGLNLGVDGKLVCKGLATNWNRVVAYDTVQEQSGTSWGTPLNGMIVDASGDTSTLLIARFTDWSVLAQDAAHLAISNRTSVLVRDCQFHGGAVFLHYPSAPSAFLNNLQAPLIASDPALNNCLLDRVNTVLSVDGGFDTYVQNGLFLGGTFNFKPINANAVVQNNLFDQTVIPDNSAESGTYLGGYNAYVTNFDRLQPTSTNDAVLTIPLTYQAGPLGNYYQSATSPLLNAGGTNADALGLYDYTVLTNIVSDQEIKETNSVVDIGYHYVTVDTNGTPISTYTNGQPDYLYTSSTDEIPDWWLWHYFGNLSHVANEDYDADGTNIFTEYQNGVDPNKISFAFAVPNQYVSTSMVSGSITIWGGVPTSMAILVDSTNFASATWMAYTSSIVTLNLGTNQGSHEVWIGLRGLPADAYQTWQNTTLVLDSVSVSIAITSPTNNSSFGVSRINVRGNFAAGSLKQITVNGVLAFTSGTNFDALNVPLDVGTNTITALIEGLTGLTNTSSVTIVANTNSAGELVDPVQLTADPVGGFTPLPVTLTVQTNLPGTITQVLYDFNGDDVIDLVTNSLTPVSYTYTNGEYFPVVTIQTSMGWFSSSGGWNSVDPNRLRINVQAAATILSTISITDPVDIQWTASSHLYVLSGSTATITEYDNSGSVVRSLSGIGTNPSGLGVDAAGNVYVAVTASNQVWKFFPTNSSFIADTNFGIGGCIGLTNGLSGTNNGEFNAPFDVAVSPDGSGIAVSDSGNHRIQQFSATGNFLGKFGAQGTNVGQFNTPKGLTYDAVGTLYIVDSGNNRVVLASGGFVEGVTGTNGTALGQLSGPVGICVSERGGYVSDLGNNRIQSFSAPVAHNPLTASSSKLRFAISSGLSQPAAVAVVDSLTNDVFYVADKGNNRVVLYAVDAGNPIPAWTNMVALAATGDFSGAVCNFSVASMDQYRRAFLTAGTTNAVAALNDIGTLIPVFIMDNAAQFYFEQVIAGQTITFPVEFVKENGVWKIVEF